MMIWATIVALASGALIYVNPSSSMLVEIAELSGVVALFTLVCAAEGHSEPKG